MSVDKSSLISPVLVWSHLHLLLINDRPWKQMETIQLRFCYEEYDYHDFKQRHFLRALDCCRHRNLVVFQRFCVLSVSTLGYFAKIKTSDIVIRDYHEFVFC